MRKLKVESVMTPEVVTASPETPFKELTRLMSEHRISGIPIVDEDRRLVGIVTEADLLWSEKEREPKRRSRFLEWFIDRKRLAEIERVAPDLRARDLMTREVVTVGPQTPVREAVVRLLRAGVKRLPVVDDDGRIVGVVSRGDLLEPFLRSDEDIRREVVDEVIVGTMWLDPLPIHVEVERGIVRLTGQVDLRSTKDILVDLVDRVDGVVGVVDELTHRREDRDVRSFGPTVRGPVPPARAWTRSDSRG
ncbi:MAG: CBS domain-containing protein [Actinomycetota bacterium]